jgi:DNA invertase Pin-like site-specific DNA recombinase
MRVSRPKTKTLSGTTSVRPELSKLWQTARARKIDTVLVWKFDRFARSTKQLIDALEEFRHLGVDFISITEQIDTGSPMGKAMFTVISAIAEFERSLISERVRSGLAKARAHSKQLGRPKASPETMKEIKRLRKQGKGLTQIAKQLGVSYQTVANYS